MKNMKYLIVSAFAALLLAGCSDASAKLKSANDVVMTVGSATITKGEIYNAMAVSSGGSQIASDAKNAIAKAEIEVTDEIKESAQSTLDLYSSLYGDSFATMLETSGMTQEEYLNDYLIPSLQGEKLVDKYIDEHFDEIAAAYDPVQTTILTFTAKEDAEAALASLRDGSKTPAVVEKQPGLDLIAAGNPAVKPCVGQSLAPDQGIRASPGDPDLAGFFHNFDPGGIQHPAPLVSQQQRIGVRLDFGVSHGGFLFCERLREQ